jgi:primosomal protein N'
VNPAARVVPDVATFAVDHGFWYSIPDHLSPELRVGSIVRVPLSGRRVRGWVVEIADKETERLKDIAGISGWGPVFDTALLQSLRWAAQHYIAPVATLLGRATPPNLPRSVPESPPWPPASAGHGLSSRDQSSGGPGPVVALVDSWHQLSWVSALSLLTAGKSILVIVGSVLEVGQIRFAADRLWGPLGWCDGR